MSIELGVVKDENDVIEDVEKGIGWFKVCVMTWEGTGGPISDVEFKERTPIDSRASTAYEVFADKVMDVVHFITSVVSKTEDPYDFIEFKCHVTGHRLNEELVRAVYVADGVDVGDV